MNLKGHWQKYGLGSSWVRRSVLLNQWITPRSGVLPLTYKTKPETKCGDRHPPCHGYKISQKYWEAGEGVWSPSKWCLRSCLKTWGSLVVWLTGNVMWMMFATWLERGQISYSAEGRVSEGSRGENRALGRRTERPRCWPGVSLSGAEILQAKLQVVHTGVPLHDFFFFIRLLGAGNGDTQLQTQHSGSQDKRIEFEVWTGQWESLKNIKRGQQDGSAGLKTGHHAQGPEFDTGDPHRRRKEPTDFSKMPSDLQVPDTVCAPIHVHTQNKMSKKIQ